MNFARLATALGIAGLLALFAGVVIWHKDNTGDPGYFHCLYASTYKWEGRVSQFSNPRWNPNNTACRPDPVPLEPPLLNGIGVALIFLALVIGYASRPLGSSPAAQLQRPVPTTTLDELLKCRDRHPLEEPTLFWQCAKGVLLQSKIDRRLVNEAIAKGDGLIDLHLKGHSSQGELNDQLADILGKATD